MSAGIYVAPRLDRAVASDCAVEWDKPLVGWTDDEDGDQGTTDSISMMVMHDPGGQLWIRLSMGDERFFIRPENARDFADSLSRRARNWSQCHWDLALDACVSKTCLMKPGNSHIGRLSEWERTRNRRVTGEARDPEIQRLHEAGLNRAQIAARVGWSHSTVSKVIREATR